MLPSVQANGLHMSAGNVIVVAITATLAAIGSASIPNSALVSMVTVLQAVGMSQYIPQLSILLAMDWLIGMFRWVHSGAENLLSVKSGVITSPATCQANKKSCLQLKLMTMRH